LPLEIKTSAEASRGNPLSCREPRGRNRGKGKGASERSINVIDDKTAEEIIESVFTFDYVGDSMMEVRRNLAAVDLQQKLIKETVEAAITQAGDNSAESMAVLTKAAEARVQRYVAGSKAATGTGCGG
jgi:hypothetical protein